MTQENTFVSKETIDDEGNPVTVIEVTYIDTTKAVKTKTQLEARKADLQKLTTENDAMLALFP